MKNLMYTKISAKQAAVQVVLDECQLRFMCATWVLSVQNWTTHLKRDLIITFKIPNDSISAIANSDQNHIITIPKEPKI